MKLSTKHLLRWDQDPNTMLAGRTVDGVPVLAVATHDTHVKAKWYFLTGVSVDEALVHEARVFSTVEALTRYLNGAKDPESPQAVVDALLDEWGSTPGAIIAGRTAAGHVAVLTTENAVHHVFRTLSGVSRRVEQLTDIQLLRDERAFGEYL